MKGGKTRARENIPLTLIISRIMTAGDTKRARKQIKGTDKSREESEINQQQRVWKVEDRREYGSLGVQSRSCVDVEGGFELGGVVFLLSPCFW